MRRPAHGKHIGKTIKYYVIYDEEYRETTLIQVDQRGMYTRDDNESDVVFTPYTALKYVELQSG